jgi:hypothetical protein
MIRAHDSGCTVKGHIVQSGEKSSSDMSLIHLGCSKLDNGVMGKGSNGDGSKAVGKTYVLLFHVW